MTNYNGQKLKFKKDNFKKKFKFIDILFVLNFILNLIICFILLIKII